MDETYERALGRKRREAHMARIHALAHDDIVEGCEECSKDAAYLDSMTLDQINVRLDRSIAAAKVAGGLSDDQREECVAAGLPL
jgi:hypothetical protein